MIPPQETTGLRESREYHERRGVTESDWRQTHRGSEGTRQTRQRQTPILKQPSSYWGKRTAYSNVFPRPTSGKSPPAGGVGISGGVDGGGGGAGDISSRVIQPRQYEVPPFALAGARGGVIDWETPVPLARGAESGNSYSSSLTPSSSPATSKDTILAVDLTPRTSTSARSRFEAGYIAALASRETGHRCRKARGAATVTVLTKSEEKQMEKRDAPLDRGSDCSEEFSNRATNEDCTKRTRGLGCKVCWDPQMPVGVTFVRMYVCFWQHVSCTSQFSAPSGPPSSIPRRTVGFSSRVASSITTTLQSSLDMTNPQTLAPFTALKNI